MSEGRIYMYEALTAYIPEFDKLKTRELYIKDETEGPCFGAGTRFENEAGILYKIHPELNYRVILDKKHIKWDFDSMSTADVSTFDGETVAALIIAALRAEHFCTGALAEFVLAGCINRWLLRLKAIDEEKAKPKRVNQRRKKQDLPR